MSDRSAALALYLALRAKRQRGPSEAAILELHLLWLYRLLPWPASWLCLAAALWVRVARPTVAPPASEGGEGRGAPRGPLRRRSPPGGSAQPPAAPQ